MRKLFHLLLPGDSLDHDAPIEINVFGFILQWSANNSKIHNFDRVSSGSNLASIHAQDTLQECWDRS